MAISDAQREIVLDALERGDSLRTACTEAGLSTHSHWLYEIKRDDALFDRYARAREIGYLLRADRLMDTAADMSIPADHKRILVDTQKWELSKMLPRLFGDRLDINHTGKAATGSLTTEELERMVASMRIGQTIDAEAGGGVREG